MMRQHFEQLPCASGYVLLYRDGRVRLLRGQQLIALHANVGGKIEAVAWGRRQVCEFRFGTIQAVCESVTVKGIGSGLDVASVQVDSADGVNGHSDNAGSALLAGM